MSYETELDDMVSVLTTENQQLKARIKELEAVVSEMETSQPKWISVKDRLPEDRQEVLVDSVKGIFLATYLKGYKTCFYIRGLYNFTIKGVKNWMPLPEPPTTEKDN